MAGANLTDLVTIKVSAFRGEHQAAFYALLTADGSDANLDPLRNIDGSERHFLARWSSDELARIEMASAGLREC